MAIQQRAPRHQRLAPRGAAVFRGSPQLHDGNVTLRALRQRDASSLLAHFSRPLVQRHAAGCPSSLEGVRRFVRWARAEQRKGMHFTFGIIPAGEAGPVGIIQLWAIDRDFSTAEWGLVLSDAYWGTGVFSGAARLLLDFAFHTVGVRRLEARTIQGDGRSRGSLLKLGARQEGLLREGLRDGDVIRDQVMWSILAHEWRATQAAPRKPH